jgi:hypothetical protein
MRISRPDELTVELSELDEIGSELLRQILPSARADDDPLVRDRLYSSPTRGRDPEFDRDWKELVDPDLRELFRDAQQVVERDLKRLFAKNAAAADVLRIPVKHLDAWIHTLNQARLALASKYRFTDRDMENVENAADDRRGFALFQVHFYGFLQECFLRQLERE